MREEIRSEELARLDSQERTLNSTDRRYLALFVTFTLAAGIILPVAGALAGLTVRAFRWAAGW